MHFGCMDLRIGHGIDFHRLIEDEKRPLMIGGTEIPGRPALEGHSDADVLLHALCDAIAGALGLGDIGEYFPDTEPAHKNLDSTVILNKYLDLMKEKGFVFCNLDITLVGERPKILPHRHAIQSRLAELSGLAPEKIGLKATTTERMGALGRKEGLACFASVLLRKS